MGPAPESVVDAQLDAYGEGDLEAFLECFADDATVRSLDDGAVQCDGRDAIRTEYAPILEGDGSLDCEVLERISLGPYVALLERVSGADGEMEALAVYRVADGEIADLQIGYAD